MELTAINHATSGVTAPVEPAAPNPQAEDRRALIKAVRAVNEAELYGEYNELSFSFDRETQRPVVRIVDRSTREVIQQIPAEYILRMAEKLKGG